MSSEQFAQHTPAESYHEIKGALWRDYMATITPALKKFQELTRDISEDINDKGKRAKTHGYKLIYEAFKTYNTLCLPAFEKYINALSLAYIKEQLEQRAMNLDDFVTASQKLVKHKTKRKPKTKTTKRQKKRKIYKPRIYTKPYKKRKAKKQKAPRPQNATEQYLADVKKSMKRKSKAATKRKARKK